MGATSGQTFRFLRFPAALPVIFSGIKTSATIAATAAIVAEFVGANQGLGYVLLRGTSTMDIELVFAVLVVLTIIGIAINYLVEFSEWAMTPWQRSKTISEATGQGSSAAAIEKIHVRWATIRPAQILRRRSNAYVNSKMLIAGALAVGLGLAASTVATAQTPITFQLNWVAGERTPGLPPPSWKAITRLLDWTSRLSRATAPATRPSWSPAARSQLAYADAVAISQLIAKGAPMKVLSTVYQSNPNEVSALKKTGIKSIKDLVGKKVGCRPAHRRQRCSRCS